MTAMMLHLCEDFDFVATLTNTANRTIAMRTTLADITSTLTFTAVVRLNGTVVQYRGSTATRFPVARSTFNVADQSMLLHVACVAAKFGYLEIKFIEVGYIMIPLETNLSQTKISSVNGDKPSILMWLFTNSSIFG